MWSDIESVLPALSRVLWREPGRHLRPYWICLIGACQYLGGSETWDLIPRDIWRERGEMDAGTEPKTSALGWRQSRHAGAWISEFRWSASACDSVRVTWGDWDYTNTLGKGVGQSHMHTKHCLRLSLAKPFTPPSYTPKHVTRLSGKNRLG